MALREAVRPVSSSQPAVLSRTVRRRARYERSAQLFADTQSRLEEVALRFVAHQEYGALRIFLLAVSAALQACMMARDWILCCLMTCDWFLFFTTPRDWILICVMICDWLVF